ncbi:chromosome segregation and condensation protein ScpA-like protein [Thermococcus cleftensis]|uniref:Chromosome segregation and condensation protein ScpA-like protein n=1 Tax=Thermococcus cleftensis (strain DSM 27260 / KACC 17922 / CL1) TaxID=163003 RepID=I3ZVS7_THECF|nr:ScpA family protein [Thermococcus cleftensis]AFL95811.1 chromosome segregation and condensation protein ScpA-like protein [Thermococcus cleftensis]
MESRREEEITPVDILLQLVQMGKVDPWNIDIVDLTEKYIERLREMKELDLRVSARAILAASILVRMKSEALLHADEEEEEERKEERLHVEVEPLAPPLRRVERYYTFDDLLDALMDALEEAEKRKPRKKKKVEIEEEVFVVDDFRVDIEKHVYRLHEIVVNMYRETREPINFWDLVFDPTPKIIARTFLYLLFLSNMGKVDLIQEEPFGEILVVPVGEEA